MKTIKELETLNKRYQKRLSFLNRTIKEASRIGFNNGCGCCMDSSLDQFIKDKKKEEKRKT